MSLQRPLNLISQTTLDIEEEDSPKGIFPWKESSHVAEPGLNCGCGAFSWDGIRPGSALKPWRNNEGQLVPDVQISVFFFFFNNHIIRLMNKDYTWAKRAHLKGWRNLTPPTQKGFEKMINKRNQTICPLLCHWICQFNLMIG